MRYFRYRAAVFGKTKTEVRQKIRDLKKELQTGVKAPANYTVADAVNDWLERGLKGRDEKGTIGKNRSMANKHLIPFTHKAKLKELSADDVDDWLDDRAEVLATRSLRDLLAILRRSIAYAQRRDKAARNVTLLVTAPEGRPGRPSKADPFADERLCRCPEHRLLTRGRAVGSSAPAASAPEGNSALCRPHGLDRGAVMAAMP
ncbi:hypothetical protein [Streptomyces sp. TRM68367]|uniref:hypothetical protein n=1 Tax=Streptomyces sp. TRM68367 TaxID=2758415 RepID=UPI0021D265F6|nr:hypothetical protein [Streptomyces sp. TRM68367]